LVKPRGVSGTLNWSTEAADLTSITAYRELSTYNMGDVDGRADVRSFEVDQQLLEQSQWSQEVYLSSDHLGQSPLKWTLGAFHLEEDNEFHWALRIFAPPTTQVFDQKTKSSAVYTQVTYPLTERLNVTAGVRHTKESKELHAVQYLPSNTVPAQEITLNPDFNFHDKIETERTNWRAALDYSISDDVMLYANAGTGFRSGGFNGSARDVPSIVGGSFGPESTFMTEAGVKADLLQRRLRVNALYYYAEYDDLQLAITNPDGTILASNVQAKVHGFEAEITALPTDSLQLTASVGTINDDIKNSPRELKDSPSLQYRVGAQYRVPVGTSGSTFGLGVDMSYSSEYFNDTNNAPGTEVQPYYMWNANAFYELAGGRWKFTLAGYNLSDELYSNHTFNIADGFISSVYFPITPRRWMFTVEFNY
jgi:iron complex outermembrane receptor protein